ncbi:MAG TPA: M48 family metalloprotease [Thermoplasmata archaeon]|jgi:Zn-dependent protease with chaperone function|nr:M48 family metalloprotease [Thermoplasmata archaeon]
MQATDLVWVLLPVAGWLAAGLGLAVAVRRASSATALRLAVLFVAGWAVFATTALVWVALDGGWSAVLVLARAPFTPFQSRYYLFWVAGAAGAFGVFLAAFLLSQAVGRGFLLALRPRPLPWPAAVAAPATPTSLLSYAGPEPNAFTFTLLERGASGGLRRRDVVLISEGLLELLTDDEQAAVVAHELGHARELDGRYLTFLRTFARMMRWDPVLGYVASALTAREEFRADWDAVELTHHPRALARALFKASRVAPMSGLGAGLLGVGGARGRRQAVERIRRLVALAESGRYPEEPGG